MNRPAKKSYWDSPKQQRESRAVRSCEVSDLEVDIDVSSFNTDVSSFNTDRHNRMRVMNELNPQVYTGMAENLYNSASISTGLSSAIPFSQSQFLMYGALFAGINRNVLAKINGQGPNVAGPNTYSIDAPGGVNFKFGVGEFYCHLVPATQSPNARYLMAPQNIGDTGGNALALNGLASRIIVLVCGESVTFTVDPHLSQVSSQNYQTIGVYFSSFPVGGTNSSSVNSMDGNRGCTSTVNTASANGCNAEDSVPGLLTNTTLLYPGTMTLITPTSNWGFLVYLCCTAGFGMYCPVIVVTLAQSC